LSRGGKRGRQALGARGRGTTGGAVPAIFLGFWGVDRGPAGSYARRNRRDSRGVGLSFGCCWWPGWSEPARGILGSLVVLCGQKKNRREFSGQNLNRDDAEPSRNRRFVADCGANGGLFQQRFRTKQGSRKMGRRPKLPIPC